MDRAARSADMDIEDRVEVAERAARAGAAVASATFREELATESKGEETDVVTEADRAAQRQAVATARQSFPDDTVVGEESMSGSEPANADNGTTPVPETGAVWIVDPIDGTYNYVRGLRVWATSVAAVVDGDPVAAANVLPAMGDVYVADEDGTRRNGERVSVSEQTDPEAFTVAPTLRWNRNRRAEYAAACQDAVERFDDVRRFGSAQATLSAVADGGLDGAFSNVRGEPWDTVAGAYMVSQAGGTVTDVHGDPWRPGGHGLVASNGESHGALLAAAQAAEAASERRE